MAKMANANVTYARQFVKENWFNRFILSCITVNTICIALLADKDIQQSYSWHIEFIDYTTLGIYMWEITLKFAAFGLSFFRSYWNIFDLSIVLLSMMEVIITFLLGNLGEGQFDPKIFRLVRIFRSFRAIRALRILRTITFFSSLQLIVSTLLKSIPAWGSISFIITLVMYIFAVIGQTLFSESDAFSSLWTTLYSLFSILTLDDWYEIYQETKDIYPTMVLYLIAFIVTETFIFVNLFIAVIVNNLAKIKHKKELVNDENEQKDNIWRITGRRRKKEESINLMYNDHNLSKTQLNDVAYITALMGSLEGALHKNSVIDLTRRRLEVFKTK